MMKIFMKAFLASLMVLMPCSIQAQESNGFKKIDVKEDFTENGFTWFHDAELLAAGNKGKSNAMTIGWELLTTLRQRW